MNQRVASYFFAGNRFNVLNEMISLGLNIKKIFAVKASYLERELQKRQIEYCIIESKAELINQLMSSNFDIFVSNGLPYKLPISKVSKGSKFFINIHPSFLPDLRGADPVPGSILFQRASGASCHFMNDELDKGDIIERVKIPYSKFWGAAELYQLSFEAERQVFLKAFENGFQKKICQEESPGLIYYTFHQNDLKINFNEPVEKILARIKAFNTKSKGAFFECSQEFFRVYDAEILSDLDIHDMLFIGSLENRKIVVLGENSLIVYIHGTLMSLKDIKGDFSKIKVGDYLS